MNNKGDKIPPTMYTCKKCGAHVAKGAPGFGVCECQQLCGNCYLKEEDRKERAERLVRL